MLMNTDISDILECELLPWAREQFEGTPWTFQQEARLCALTWLKNDPTVDSGPHPGIHQQGRLVLKEPGPESFELFGVVHPREQPCRTSHDSLENLKAKLQREWALIPQEFCVPRAMPFKRD